MSERWLFVGLGNPGKKYQNNRHNIGFLLLDHMFEQAAGRSASWKNFEGAHYAQIEDAKCEAFLLKPQEFMNNSGRSVAAFMNFYNIDLQQLVVVHDEVEIPFATMRLKKGGGHAGHNGIKSISSHLSSGEFFRLRLGVDRPIHPEFALADWVLSDFSREEQNQMSLFLSKAYDCLSSLQALGLSATQAKFNS